MRFVLEFKSQSTAVCYIYVTPPPFPPGSFYPAYGYGTNFIIRGGSRRHSCSRRGGRSIGARITPLSSTRDSPAIPRIKWIGARKRQVKEKKKTIPSKTLNVSGWIRFHVVYNNLYRVSVN